MIDALRGLIAWTPMGLPAFLFVITMVVFFHELGHFLVGRLFGVKVDVFSIGFGRELIGFNDKHGTRWRLSMLPIGGYVRFAGDADAASRPDTKAGQHMSAEQKSGALMFKPLYQRALVAVAGPVANFILAIVMLTGLLLYSGHTTILPVAGAITKGGPADLAGIKTGDRITRIGIADITDFRQVQTIVGGSNGKPLEMELSRAGHSLTVQVTPHKTQIKDDAGKTQALMLIGINRDAKAVIQERYSLVQAFTGACSDTWTIARTTIMGIAQMLSGHGGADQLSGPVGIAQITKQVADYGWLPLLNLVAFLSVSIGLANLFPIPLLDGGHLLYYAVEAVLGRPLGERAQDVGFRLGLVLVLGLMLLTTWNDLVRLNLF